MPKKLSALVWLRWKIVLSNKSILLQILLPFAFTYLYKYLDSLSGSSVNQNNSTLMMCLAFAFTLAVGSPITVILAEEKEKKNLQTLLMSGVKDYEYIISTLLLPFLITFIVIVVTPLILESKINGWFFEYSIITIFTGIVIILLHLLFGIIVRSQVSGQIMSLFAMLLVSFLPVFSSFDKNIAKFADYSFMGLFVRLFNQGERVSWGKNILPSISLVVWFLGLITINLIVLNKNRRRN